MNEPTLALIRILVHVGGVLAAVGAVCFVIAAVRAFRRSSGFPFIIAGVILVAAAVVTFAFTGTLTPR